MTRSTAPIALLVFAGLLGLGFAAGTPTASTEVRHAPPVERVGDAVSYTVTSSTDQTGLAMAIAALVLAVVAFGAAAYLGVRRARSRRAAA